MKEIASNEYYLLSVDSDSNRVYMTIKGYWKSLDLVPEFGNDVRRAVQLVAKGFTLLADLTGMKVPPPEVSTQFAKFQKIWLDGGLSKTAEVHSNVVLKMATNRISQESGMMKGVFASKQEAEEWLDS